MNIQKIERSKFNPAPYNPRKRLWPGDAEYEKLMRSIQEFGVVEPIVEGTAIGRDGALGRRQCSKPGFSWPFL